MLKIFDRIKNMIKRHENEIIFERKNPRCSICGEFIFENGEVDKNFPESCNDNKCSTCIKKDKLVKLDAERGKVISLSSYKL